MDRGRMARNIAVERARGRVRIATPRRWWDSLWVPVVAFSVVALGGAALLSVDWVAAPVQSPFATSQSSVQFDLCVAGQGQNCVIDGDTFRQEGVIIRIADIDTPEVRDFDCAAEKALGDRATLRLVALLNDGPFGLAAADRDEDRYGRKLRIVNRAGQSVGVMLVDEGLARHWDGARHSWC